MTADPELRLRADARRNRDQLIAAAKVMFTEAGPDVPMDEIARRAGVGVGTLYRRFPDREALVRAVALDNYAQVLAFAQQAADEEPTAWGALVLLLSKSRELRLTVQLALMYPETWELLRRDLEAQRYHQTLLDVLDKIVRGAQEEGALRDDIGSGDVAVLVSLLLRRLPTAKDRVADAMMDRMLALLLDGLRPREGSTLPGKPLTTEDLRAR